MNPKPLIWAGGGLFIVMALLLAKGTTSTGLFLTWGVLAIVGIGLAAFGQRLEKQATHARLEAERRASGPPARD